MEAPSVDSFKMVGEPFPAGMNWSPPVTMVTIFGWKQQPWKLVEWLKSNFYSIRSLDTDFLNLMSSSISSSAPLWNYFLQADKMVYRQNGMDKIINQSCSHWQSDFFHQFRFHFDIPFGFLCVFITYLQLLFTKCKLNSMESKSTQLLPFCLYQCVQYHLICILFCPVTLVILCEVHKRSWD